MVVWTVVEGRGGNGWREGHGGLLKGWLPAGADAGGLEPMLGSTTAASDTAGVLPDPVRDSVPGQALAGSLLPNSLNCSALRVSSMSLRAPSLALSW